MKFQNTTSGSSRRPDRRRYGDACGTAHALELVGDRWALLVVREMMLGPRRFSDLRRDLPGISAAVLSQRLDELEAAGIVQRETLPPPARVQVYGLTPWGLEAEPVLQELGRWAARSPGHDPTMPLSPVSIMLSFRTMIDRGAAAGCALAIGFRFGDDLFTVRLGGKEGIAVTRGLKAPLDVMFACTPEAMAAAAYGKVPLAALAADGLLRIEGDAALAERFVALFALPPKAAPPARGIGTGR